MVGARRGMGGKFIFLRHPVHYFALRTANEIYRTMHVRMTSSPVARRGVGQPPRDVREVRRVRASGQAGRQRTATTDDGPESDPEEETIAEMENQSDEEPEGSQPVPSGPGVPGARASDAVPCDKIPDFVQHCIRGIQASLNESRKAKLPHKTGLVEGGWVAPAPAELRRPTKFDRQKPRVRGWLPEYLSGAGVITPKCPRCKSNDRVTVKEWVSRRVVDTHDCYWLVGKAYQCGQCADLGRRVGFRSWNPDVVKMLDPSLVRKLDVVFTAKVALSSKQAKSILMLGKKGNTFESIRSMLSETHIEQYTELEIQYRLDVKYYNRLPEAQFFGKQPVEKWSAFDDPTEYNGYVPGPKYIIETYIRMVTDRAEHVRRRMQMIDADTICGDGSFKVSKLIHLAGGAQVKVRARPSAPTKFSNLLAFLVGALNCRTHPGQGDDVYYDECVWPGAGRIPRRPRVRDPLRAHGNAAAIRGAR